MSFLIQKSGEPLLVYTQNRGHNRGKAEGHTLTLWTPCTYAHGWVRVKWQNIHSLLSTLYSVMPGKDYYMWRCSGVETVYECNQEVVWQRERKTQSEDHHTPDEMCLLQLFPTPQLHYWPPLSPASRNFSLHVTHVQQWGVRYILEPAHVTTMWLPWDTY